jgi:hypothetical protein
MKRIRGFLTRSKLPFLVLLYPGFAWLLLSSASTSDSSRTLSSTLIAPLTGAVYFILALSFAFLLFVPLWATRYRNRRQDMSRAFHGGLYAAFAVLAVVLPAQGAVLALALFVVDPELGVWGIFMAGGAIFGTLVLFHSGIGERPGIYLTLRAIPLPLENHPKLDSLARELAEQLNVPLPRHILVGLQPALLNISGTVFCPDGELDGGVLCLSLPACSVLSISEFRALLSEALLSIQTSLADARKDFLSTTEGARDVVTNLNESMKEWSWLPKWGLHPFLVIARLVAVSALKFPLYLGKEWIIFYVREFLAVRNQADMWLRFEAQRFAAADVGAVQALSALIKEAALSVNGIVSPRGKPAHALGEVALQVARQHPGLRLDRRVASPWLDPFSAWRYLQMRCSFSGISMEWCRQMALDVNPYPNARSLFEAPDNLEEKLMKLAVEPFVLARGSASAASAS